MKSPRYHCELQFIELFWGAMKLFLRQNCEYNIHSLRQTIPTAMNSVSVGLIRKYHNKTMCFMDCYALHVGVRLAHWLTKKYRQHRRISENMVDLMLEEGQMMSAAKDT
jgi:hypothetical protein